MCFIEICRKLWFEYHQIATSLFMYFTVFKFVSDNAFSRVCLFEIFKAQ